MPRVGLLSCCVGASHCGGFSYCGARALGFQASVVAAHWFSSFSAQVQLLRGTRDPPRSGIEPVSLALAGRSSTTGPSGKSWYVTLGLHILSTLLIEKWNQVTTGTGNILRNGILMCVNGNTHTHTHTRTHTHTHTYTRFLFSNPFLLCAYRHPGSMLGTGQL